MSPVLELEPEVDEETEVRSRRRVALGGYGRRGDAQEALEDAKDQAKRGWRGPSRLTLREYLRRDWLPGVDMELSPTTAALYRTLMEAYVIPRVGGKRLDDLTSADLTGLYAELLASGRRGGGPLAPKTVRHVHTTLRKALADAVQARAIGHNPAEGAKAPRSKPTKDPAVWTGHEVGRFISHVTGDRLEALWVLAATTGMRRSELLGLRWSDLDLDAGQLHVRQVYVAYGKLRVLKEPKSQRSRRSLPLSPAVVGGLRRHRIAQAEERLRAGPAYADHGLVFTDELGEPLRPDRVSFVFAGLVREAGLPRLTPHGLRHSFATIGLDAGVDVLYIAELLGHSSPVITQGIYQHVRRDRLTGAAAAIAEAISG